MLLVCPDDSESDILKFVIDTAINCKITHAVSSEDALEQLSTSDPNVVILSPEYHFISTWLDVSCRRSCILLGATEENTTHYADMVIPFSKDYFARLLDAIKTAVARKRGPKALEPSPRLLKRNISVVDRPAMT